jgi:acyl carrier protein
MMPMNEARAELRRWVVETSGRIEAKDLRDDTPLIEQRIITSLQITDLILFLESLRGVPVDLEKLSGSSFKNIDAVCSAFLSDVP